MNYGYLIVSVNVDSEFQPVPNARVEVLGTDGESMTDMNGMSDMFELEAPSPEASSDPYSEVRPYSTYDIRVTKEGLVPFIVRNVEIYPNVTSTQTVVMSSTDEVNLPFEEEIVEPPVLWGNYAPTVADEEQPTAGPGIGAYILKSVIIPGYVIVHDGAPSDTTATNYQLSFVDYIKNVACSEIYSTWPRETIKANVAAIVSFTLNRIYTEWYRSKGYDFTMTSVTLYDQKYTHGRTIFDSISKVVDEYFQEYIHFPGREEPFLAHYNDGVKLNNPGWLSQWGSKDLGDQGYSSIDILKYYYGPNVTLRTAPIVADYPSSYPGHSLELGSCSKDVKIIQNQLNVIRGNYSGIPRITNPDGEFDRETYNAVRVFQGAFSLDQTGIVDFATWYKISYVYTAVAQLVASITT